MIEPYTPTAYQDRVQGDYAQVFHWSVKDKASKAIVIQILTIPMFIVLGIGFSLFAIHLGKLPNTIGFVTILMCPAGIVGTIVLHEVLHALTMRWCGARPRFGALLRQLLFYATSPGYAFRRNSYILIAMAPLVLLSGLAILGMLLLQGRDWVVLLALCAAINGSGAVGDLWLVSIALRYPAIAYIVDERDGLRVLLRREWSSE